MANLKEVRNVDPVTVELGGRTRTIRYDLNAFAELEKRYGSVDAAMESLQAGRLGDIRNILWAGLIHEEVELDEVTGEPVKYHITPYQVGSWVGSPAAMAEVGAKIAQVMAADMPDAQNMVKTATEQAKKVVPEGVEIAKVVLTPEEEAAQEEERKNG